MGLGILLLVAAVVVLASLQHGADLKILNKEYEEWKTKRRQRQEARRSSSRSKPRMPTTNSQRHRLPHPSCGVVEHAAGC